jgi:hypothetical protein
LLSGTAAFTGAGVAAGLGKGVAIDFERGVGDGLGAVVCGLGWAMTQIDIIPISMSTAKIERFLFITFPPGKCSRILSSAYTDCYEKEKAAANVVARETTPEACSIIV